MSNQISQIQVGGVTYDICDTTARDLATNFMNLQKISIWNKTDISISPTVTYYYRILLNQITDFENTDWKILSIDSIDVPFVGSYPYAIPQSWKIFSSGRGFYLYLGHSHPANNSNVSILAGRLRVGLILINSNNSLILPSTTITDTRSYELDSTNASEQ